MPALYLDTSDLSYLLRRPKPAQADKRERWRKAVAECLRGNRVRLRISPVHLAEIALHTDVTAGAVHWVRTVSNIFITLTQPHEVLRAELEGKPVVLIERELVREDIERLQIPLRLPGLSASGTTIARFIKTLLNLQAHATNLGKTAAKRSLQGDPSRRTAASRITKALLAGKHHELPPSARPIGRLFSIVTATMLKRLGLPPNALALHSRQQHDGLDWTTTLSRGESTLPRGPEPVVADEVRRYPATALRASVELAVVRDTGRPATSNSSYDALHMAYVAYSDVATVDRENIGHTRAVRRHLENAQIVPTAQLDAVLAAIARAH